MITPARGACWRAVTCVSHGQLREAGGLELRVEGASETLTLVRRDDLVIHRAEHRAERATSGLYLNQIPNRVQLGEKFRAAASSEQAAQTGSRSLMSAETRSGVGVSTPSVP